VSTRFRNLDKVLMASGLVLLGIWGAAWLHKTLLHRASLRAFEETALAARAPAASPTAPPLPEPPAPPAASLPTVPDGNADTSLWSEKRIRSFRESLSASFAPPLAVLRIPKIGVVVAVLEGTDDLTLNRGVGHIEGTPRPGEAGNAGVAGHRDGFFRGLKDVREGDRFDLETARGTEEYRVEMISIVDPDDVSVLDPAPGHVLTLVSCYPFYFVGDAPQRYIVRAVRVEPAVR
jgi:sortase A